MIALFPVYVNNSLYKTLCDAVTEEEYKNGYTKATKEMKRKGATAMNQNYDVM